MKQPSMKQPSMKQPSMKQPGCKIGRDLVVVALGVAMGAFFSGCAANDMGATNEKLLEIVAARGLTVQVGATVELQARVQNAAALLVTYRWAVSDGNQRPVNPTSVAGHNMSFVAAIAGSYDVTCWADIEGYGTLKKQATITAAASLTTYRVRITPPPESGIPPFSETFKVSGGDSLSRDFRATEAHDVTVDIRWKGAPLPVYANVYLDATDPRPRRFFFAKGHGTLPVTRDAQILLLTDDQRVASLLRSVGTTVYDLTVALDDTNAGMDLTGRVEVDGAVGLEGATVAVHTVENPGGIAVPSTLGLSDAKGSYALKTRTGIATLVVVPPAAMRLPVARVSSPALRVTGATTDWVFRYKAVETATLAGKVVDAQDKPLSGATVFLHADDLANVGTLMSPGGVSIAARGFYRVEFTTDNLGALVPGPASSLTIPKGNYGVEIRPPKGALAGVTMQSLTIVDGKNVTLKVRKKAEVSGLVLDSRGAPTMAQVVLRGPKGSVAGLTQQEGSFALKVDPGFAYTLMVRPNAFDVDSAPVIMGDLKVDDDQALGELRMPSATRVVGTVRTYAGTAIPGALLQVTCEKPACGQGGIIDEIRSDSGGAFELRVPRVSEASP